MVSVISALSGVSQYQCICPLFHYWLEVRILSGIATVVGY